MTGCIVVVSACTLVAVAIAVPWANALERTAEEWKEHRNDPDYWDWP